MKNENPCEKQICFTVFHGSLDPGSARGSVINSNGAMRDEIRNRLPQSLFQYANTFPSDIKKEIHYSLSVKHLPQACKSS